MEDLVARRPTRLLAAVWPRVAALCDQGCAVHLALQDVDPVPGQASLDALGSRDLAISIGYAVPRRDRWTAIAERLSERPPAPDLDEDEAPKAAAALPAPSRLRTALPADPGILAYLRQLDLDLVVLTDLEATDGAQFDYLLACRQLRIATEAVELESEDAADADQVSDQTQAQRPVAPSPGGLSLVLSRAVLWTVLLGNQLGPPLRRLLGMSEEAGVQKSLKARLQDAYVERVFPWLVSGLLRLLPGTHPVLLDLSRQLSPMKLGEMMTIETAMAAACQGSGPIIFGPWTADIDTELLFWIPFLRWYRRRYQIDRSRIVTVSRDDTRSWYEGVGGRYLDIGELYSVEDVAGLDAQRTEELTKRNKQYAFTRADQIICRKVSKRLSAARLNVLHPRTMHALFERYMTEVNGHAYLAAYTRYQPLSIKPAKVRQL
jgi:hypothetical protein